MSNDVEEKPNNVLKFPGTKSVIFDTFNQLKKWREEQVQQFQNLRLLENQKLLQQSQENRKNLEQLLEKRLQNDKTLRSSMAGDNESDCGNSMEESTISGHLRHCFSDTSQDSPVSSRIKECHTDTKHSTSNGFQSLSRLLELKNSEKHDKLEESTNNSSSTSNGFESFTDLLELKSLEMNDQQGTSYSTNALMEKPKRPFLKKGSGLLKYMPKSSRNIDSNKRNKPLVSQKVIPKVPIKTLKLKAADVNNFLPPKEKCVRFEETSMQPNNRSATSKQQSCLPEENGIDQNADSEHLQNLTNKYYSDFEKEQLAEGKNAICNESLNLEQKELAEFEILENCAQNSSFNSDSSVIQRVLSGGTVHYFFPAWPPPSKPPNNPNTDVNSQIFNVNSSERQENKNDNVHSVYTATANLSKCLQTRQQQLQQFMLDTNLKVESLQKEICNMDKNSLSKDHINVSERCSTPLLHVDSEDVILNPALPSKSDKVSSAHSTVHIPENAAVRVCDSSSDFHIPVDSATEDKCEKITHPESKENSPNILIEAKQTPSPKSKIREKVEELEKEIAIYQEQNARLSLISKEREETVNKLKKEQEEFQKYKEKETKKLKDEMEEERKQIKRQKDTFTRFQKLRKDNPSRKEREELSALRQEVEKLQEELKRQKIKFTNDIRRLKNQLVAAEKDRDSLKLQNITLEDQCQDLLTALKARSGKKKKSELSSKSNAEKVENCHIATATQNLMKENTNASPLSQNLSEENCGSSTKSGVNTKQRVRFNLVPQYKEDLNEITQINLETEDNVVEIQQNDVDAEMANECETSAFLYSKSNEIQDFDAENAVLPHSELLLYDEVKHDGDKVERIYTSGEREVLFLSGTRKLISADGKVTKFFFYNGDVKEILPDGKEIYKYINGTIEKHFPDGLELTEFPNGQVQYRYPDGSEEVKFEDGTTHYIHVDGSEEIHTVDGTIVTLGTDGTETVELQNGQKEIRTPNFRRREYPDGSVKIIYASGRQESRHSNGRIRIKDKEGKLLVDTKYHDFI